MKLSELLKTVTGYTFLSARRDADISGIACNSREVRDNFLFVAIKGAREDGHVFVPEAIEKGACAVIMQSKPRKPACAKDVIFIQVNDSRKSLAELAVAYYGRPAEKMTVIGITGTNGKTTVTYLIEALLKEKRQACAVIGTVNYRFKDIVLPSKNTTPGPLELQSMLKKFFEEKIRYTVMEVSSHALDQKRTDGIHFSAALFTNLTQDHLDYHKNIANYFSAKAYLFKNLPPSSFAVINNDDAYGRKLLRATRARTITYGIDTSASLSINGGRSRTIDCASQVFARNIKMSMENTEFMLCFREGQEVLVKTALIGKHNVYNILASAAWAKEEGFNLAEIKSAIEKFSCVPGRLEKINSHRGFFIYVDYAHTEDALRNVITSLRQISRKRIIVVFGCGGDRDRAKRPLMGRAVSELADYAVITNDNPRSEEPMAIIGDIIKGMKGANYQVVPSRNEAIRQSLSLARKGDIILIAGKGHENYQLVKDKALPFDDRQVIRECLKSLT